MRHSSKAYRISWLPEPEVLPTRGRQTYGAIELYNYFKGESETLSQQYLKVTQEEKDILKSFNYSEEELLRQPDKLPFVSEKIIPLAQETAGVW